MKKSKEKKRKDYAISTMSSGGLCLYLTSAKNPIKALERLLTNSNDFKGVKNEKFITIKITEI